MLAQHSAQAENGKACPMQPVVSMEQLACLSWCELEALYRGSAPGEIVPGYVPGVPLYDPAKRLTRLRTKVTGALWRGKHFRCDGTLINQWCGVRAIRADVYHGKSWLDGGPAIVMDYGNSSWVWADVRDEIREVAPGLFLGVMFERRCPQPRLKMFFALDARSSHCHCLAQPTTTP
jgi:hypothetical protein